MSTVPFTPTPNASPDKENSSTNSNGFHSFIHNFFNRLSPRKLGSLFKGEINSDPEQQKDGYDKIFSDNIDDLTREWLHFYRMLLIGKGSFTRKVAQITKRSVELVPTKTKLHCLPPKEGRRRQSAAVSNAKLSPLEKAVVRIKHGFSRRFSQTVKQPFAVSSDASFTQTQECTFSSDSLTIEFFNTIAPLFPGSILCEIDVFLCAVNFEQGSICFWDKICTFLSPVNEKRRNNRVFEIWVPQLTDRCDQLLLVVEGRLVKSNSQCEKSFPPRSMTSTLKQQNSLAKPKRASISIGRMALKRRATVAASELAREDDARHTKRAKFVKKQRQPIWRESGQTTQNAAMMRDCQKSKQKVPIWRKSDHTIKAEQSPQKREPSRLNASENSKVVFRGVKQIGNWVKLDDTADEPSKSAVFQPIFSHNGLILNLFCAQEESLQDMQAPKFDLIEELSHRTRNAAKGTCNMLQMEVSNENGFGSNDTDSGLQKKRILRTFEKQGQILKCEEICYTRPSAKLTGSEPASLEDLKSLPMLTSQSLLPCLICNRKFQHIWQLAVHLANNYPHLHFKFFLPEAIKLDKKPPIQVEVDAIDDQRSYGRRENFLLGRSEMTFLRSKQLLARAEKEPASFQVVNPKPSSGQSSGKFFAGVLPFKVPRYAPLKDHPPYANLMGVDFDRGWVRDVIKIRLNQFLDVSTKEKEFFKLWNLFIGKRENQPHGDHQMSFLLTRFVDEFGKMLAQQNLLSCFVSHSITLWKFSYITDQELFSMLNYTAEKSAQ